MSKPNRFGIEIEFFINKIDSIDSGDFLFPADLGLPYDEYSILGELRTGSYSDPFAMMGEMEGLIHRARATARKGGGVLTFAPYQKINKVLWNKIVRRPETHKGPIEHNNLYGIITKPKSFVVTAGLHVHFSHTSSYSYRDEEKCTHKVTEYRQMDIPGIVLLLDDLYGDQIKAAGRTKGEYELKEWGFEYRSLPCSVPLFQLAEVLDGLK